MPTSFVPSVLVLAVCFVRISQTLKQADLPELLHCEQRCRQLYHRSCSETPPHCGRCLENHQRECLSLVDVPGEESEIEKLAQQHQRHLENDDYNSGRQSQASVVEAKRDTNGSDSHTEPVVSNSDHGMGAEDATTTNTIIFIAVVAGCSVAGVVGLIVAGVCWYRLQRNVKAASDVDYPAYGVTGPTKDKVGSPGDRKLAQSAQMYHYQHQKQQMIAMEKAQGDLTKDGSDVDSEEENEEGDYTVFECPGLAPTGEMEVKNPLFNEETPVTPADTATDHPK